jgi:hypothetical protein
MKSYQKVNHFPAMYQIARKTFLAKNLKRMRKLFPNEFKFFPRSWCIPAELSELRQYFYNKQNKIRQAKADQARRLLSPRNERLSNNNDNGSIAGKSTDNETIKPSRKDSPSKFRMPPVTLIVKPDCMSQGRGIFLTNDIEQVPKDDNIIV